MSVTFWTIVSRSSVDATHGADLAELLGVGRMFAGRREQTRPLGDVARDLRGADDLAAARSRIGDTVNEIGSRVPSLRCRIVS